MDGARFPVVCVLVGASFLLPGPLCGAETKAKQSPEELTIQQTIARGGFSMAFGFDSLWVMSADRLIRINASNGAQAEITIPVSEAAGSMMEIDKYRDIAVGEGAVWVPDMGSSTIYKIDPATNELVLSIPTDMIGGEGSIGVGEGSVWVIIFENHNKTLARYSAFSGVEEARIALPNPGKEIVVDHGAVWVAAARRGELYRIDPVTNEIAATINVTDSPRYLATGHGAIWILDLDEGVVQRVDSQTNELVATIGTGTIDNDGDITTGGDSVWVITRRSTITRIEPGSNVVRGKYRGKVGVTMGRRITYGADSLWVSGSAIFKLRPPN